MTLNANLKLTPESLFLSFSLLALAFSNSKTALVIHSLERKIKFFKAKLDVSSLYTSVFIVSFNVRELTSPSQASIYRYDLLDMVQISP